MNMRKIGTDEVSAIGLGCMGITHASGAPMSIEDGAKVIETAHDLGYTLFDTAECYTGVYPDGTTAYNEEVVGKGIKSFRNEIFLASKCGVQHGGDHLILDSSPETIRKSVEGSLKRLGTDHIDLYYQHRIDPKVDRRRDDGSAHQRRKNPLLGNFGDDRRVSPTCPRRMPGYRNSEPLFHDGKMA